MTTNFDQLGLEAELLRAIKQEGYENPTEIQGKAIPAAMQGRDVLALAPTGTGKTAAFTLPLLHRCISQPTQGQRQIRALIITPTRELALQVNDSLRAYARFAKIRTAVVLGGVGMGPQIQAVKRKPEIVVATPGRLEDLIQQGHIDLSHVESFILDEADRMLDMGFIPAVRRLERQMPRERQTMLFSATMPREIESLADSLMSDPFRVAVERKEEERGNIQQRLIFVERQDKQELLTRIVKDEGVFLGLVFARTKFRADTVARKLKRAGIKADAIHGNKSQAARQRALKAFTQAKLQILVATDIAARGIDVDDITHVFNFDLADDPESHVHRIGRTARAGREGVAISFCDATETDKLVQIERVLGEAIPVDNDHDLASPQIEDRKPRRGGRGKSRGKSSKAGGHRGASRGGPQRSSNAPRGGGKRRTSERRSERDDRGRDDRGRDDRERSGRGYDESDMGDQQRNQHPAARRKAAKRAAPHNPLERRKKRQASKPDQQEDSRQRGGKPAHKRGKGATAGKSGNGASSHQMKPRRRGAKLMDRKGGPQSANRRSGPQRAASGSRG